MLGMSKKIAIKKRLSSANLTRSAPMVVFERTSQSFQFEGQAEQRKQRAAEQRSPFRHQQDIGSVIKRRNMPEEYHGE